ncbi:hypothetical protein D3C76_1242120 [compost metagenome]
MYQDTTQILLADVLADQSLCPTSGIVGMCKYRPEGKAVIRRPSHQPDTGLDASGIHPERRPVNAAHYCLQVPVRDHFAQILEQCFVPRLQDLLVGLRDL